MNEGSLHPSSFTQINKNKLRQLRSDPSILYMKSPNSKQSGCGWPLPQEMPAAASMLWYLLPEQLYLIPLQWLFCSQTHVTWSWTAVTPAPAYGSPAPKLPSHKAQRPGQTTSTGKHFSSVLYNYSSQLCDTASLTRWLRPVKYIEWVPYNP